MVGSWSNTSKEAGNAAKREVPQSRRFALRGPILLVFLASCLQLAQAEELFQTSVQASAAGDTKALACAAAFDQAEDEALTQLEEYFDIETTSNDFVARIVEQSETVTLRDDDQSVCVFSGTWEGKLAVADSSQPSKNIIGSEQYIDGVYEGRCLDENNIDLCWQRVVRQARDDLASQLSADGQDMRDLDLFYVDFEGRQRDQFREGGFEITADGRFFFDVIERAAPVSNGSMSIRRKNEPVPVKRAEPRDPPTEKSAPKKEKDDDLDVTLFFSWDVNDMADTNDLAISSDRWGIGLWAKNRVGFLAFYGSDRFGIGNDENRVQRDGDRYSTFGVGVGVRAFDSRSFNIESALYYVDAQPYQRFLDPDNCVGCARDVTADDYVQATVNFKTNSDGINIGWMFTWKYLANEANFDNLSSGLYLEVQF